MEDQLDHPMAYIEVSPSDLVSSKWREMVLNTGATQSTLQDFKLPEFAGGYTYNDSNAWLSPTSNRFIYWRTTKDVIEFTEQSLDSVLQANQLKLRFYNTPVIDSVSVNETPDEVVILVATVASVHRLVFPHPRKYGLTNAATTVRPVAGPATAASSSNVRASIFYNFSSEALKDKNSYYVLNNSSMSTTMGVGVGTANFPITCCSWLTTSKEAVFVLASNSGVLTVVKMGPVGSKVQTWELKQATFTEKIKGYLPAIIRGTHDAEDAVVSLTSHQFHEDTLIFALCRGMKVRIWSFLRHECVACQSINLHKPDNYASARRSILKKSFYQGNLHLIAYSSSNDQSQFVLYKLVKDGAHQILQSMATINSPQNEDLLDFGLSNGELWTLSLSSQLDMKIQFCAVAGSSSDWRRVALSNDILSNFSLNSLIEGSRNTFIEEIFFKGKFSIQSIAKALGAFSRTKEDNFVSMKTPLLIEELIKIIEKKVKLSEQAEAMNETTDLESLERTHWEKFYSYCIQYKNVSNKPLGLILDSKTGLVGIIKKLGVSLIVATDTANNVILVPKLETQSLLTLTDDPLIYSSLQAVLDGVSEISSILPEDLCLEFEDRIIRGEPADHVANEYAEKYLATASITKLDDTEESFKCYFATLCTKSAHLHEAIEILLQSLALDNSELIDVIGNSRQTVPVFTQMFSSPCGISIVGENLKMISRLRFNFCRDLLLFQSFILLIRDNSISPEKLSKIRENSIPSNGMHVHAYCLMNWICEVPFEPTNSLGNEQNETMLSSLELTEYIQPAKMRSKKATFQEVLPRSLIALYIERRAGSLARRYISEKFSSAEDLISSESWVVIYPHYVNAILQLIWPITVSFHFPEFLLGTSQHGTITDYVRMLDTWCDYNAFSRHFISGFVNLVSGDSSLAVSKFKAALTGAYEEPFLRKICNVPCDNLDESISDGSVAPEIVFNYYNKVVQLFKLNGRSDAIVDLMSHGLVILDEAKDPHYAEHVSSFYTTLFIHHLELGSITEAYEAMILNSDAAQRKDCLRQFIVQLCENGHISELLSFSYPDVSDDFVNILEARARSTDLSNLQKCSYYEILYAFFVNNENYRQAAASMYEYARRLGQEVHGVDSLEKQVKCYLLTLNCLKLVDKKHACVTKPVMKSRQSFYGGLPVGFGVSETPARKRTADGEALSEDSKRDTDVVGVKDVKIEFELVKARHRLLKKDENGNAMATMPLSASELITLLISNSMFDAAFHLSDITKLSYRSVFEGILSKYVHLLYMPDTGANDTLTEVYDCFAENETPFQTYVGSAESTPIDKMWHLITVYLEKYEKPGLSQLHRCVTEKLLEVGIKLPSSLRISYQKRNCPELLWLLMSFNYMEDATNLALDYVDAYLSRGYEDFDIKTPLFPNSPPVYFPHNHMQNLVSILDEDRLENPNYDELLRALQGKLKTYEDMALRESRNYLAAIQTK